MGALLTSGANFMQGIHHLFIFGFIGSIFALGSAFWIKDYVNHTNAAQKMVVEVE